MKSVKIQCLIAIQWKRYRSIRLKALDDAPDAFARTYAEEAMLDSGDWQARLTTEAATFVAVVDGSDVGLATVAKWHGRNKVAGLFGMWVAPHIRSRGVGMALVDAVIDWARTAGLEHLVLEVADQNNSAIEFYDKVGFEPTGSVSTLPPPREHITEHERTLAL